MEKRFIVGIDLGTTNSAVAYIDLKDTETIPPKIHKFRIPQLTEAGTFSTLPELPSFLYIPGKYDIADENMKTPWKVEERNNADKNFVGEFAKNHGMKVPSRLVSSAKSWLCNKFVDKQAKILPWGSSQDVFKISPVQASACYLKHIRKAWNITQKGDDSLYLENQMVILTVPASFDEVARELTLESAEMAGLNDIILLEEPSAAFYSWLSTNEKNWSNQIKPNQLILVCDVGGGTTDFTLIYLKSMKNKLYFERLAVGDHLILGGDNIDIAIAKQVANKLYKNIESISKNDWNSLCYQCRKIKENTLDGKVTFSRISIIGSGSKLISNTLSYDISSKEIEKIIFNDFFPKISHCSNFSKYSNHDQSLPYETNTSIINHLENFIKLNQLEIKKLININKICPDFVLFNGGTLKPFSIQNSIISFLTNRFSESGIKPIVIQNKDINSAVSIGAAYYGLVKHGNGVKIGSGSSRSFYVGINSSISKYSNKLKKSICLVERGLEEGSNISLPDKKFEILTNQPITIEIYSSSFRSGDCCGDIVNIDETLTILPPIRTIIKFGEKDKKHKIPVYIEANYTEVGTLELWCKSIMTPHRWQLKFNLRKNKTPSTIEQTEIFDIKKIKLTRQIVQFSFDQNNNQFSIVDLTKSITKVIGRNKHLWPLGLIRSLADTALELLDVRKISPSVEARWMNFIGFCLRPGIGEGFDSYRVKKIWKLYKQGPIHYNNSQVKIEWWIMWRRIAAGLNPGQQRQFFQDIAYILLEKKKHKKTKQEKIEIWMCIANMEGLRIEDKIKIGCQLLNEINKKKVAPQLLWALSRLGARNLLYSSIDRVIDQKNISRWLNKIISVKYHNPKPVIEMISFMAEKTGDKIRDIEPKLRDKLNEWINSFGFFPDHIEKINNIVKRRGKDQKVIFRDSIPSGIIFKVKE